MKLFCQLVKVFQPSTTTTMKQLSCCRFKLMITNSRYRMWKLKPQCLTVSDRINATEISHWFCTFLWPHVNLMPNKWHKWSKHPKSICQHILSVIGVPNGFTQYGYWSHMALSIANRNYALWHQTQNRHCSANSTA